MRIGKRVYVQGRRRNSARVPPTTSGATRSEYNGKARICQGCAHEFLLGAEFFQIEGNSGHHGDLREV